MNLVLEPREFRILEGLRLNPRKSFAGRVRGERTTTKKGVSIEFADYREYAEGDDLRHLDWNVLARLDHPVMRTYRDEEDLAVHLLVDTSPSMEFGEPSKIDVARRLATALGYVALLGGDAAYPRPLGVHERLAPLPGPRQPARLAHAVANAKSRGELSASLRAFAGSSARIGLVILLTDGLDPEAASALRLLGGRGHEVWLLQILSEPEIDPDLEGDLRLVDAEDSAVELTANSYALREYRRALEAHNQALRETLRSIGGRYALVPTHTALEALVKDPLKREGWVA